MISITSSDTNIRFAENIDKTKLAEQTARVRRTATLDGGAVLVHSGTSHTDTTLRIRATISSTDEALIQTIYTTETDLRLACGDGFFAGAIQKFNRQNGAIAIDFWPTEKIA